MDDAPDTATYRRQRHYWRSRGVRTDADAFLDALSATAPGPAGLAHEEFALRADDILRVCKGSELSLYIVLVALFKCVAARYADDGLTTVLSPPYRRDGAGGMVVVQDRLDLGDSVRSAVELVRGTVLGAYTNQDHPPDEARRLLNTTPLLLLDGIHRVEGTPCPMVIRFAPRERSLTGLVSYDAGRLRPDLVSQFLDTFVEFADNATGDYSRPVKDVPLLSPAAAGQVEKLSRGPGRAHPSAGLHELVEARARQTPDAVAVVCGSETASHADLDGMAGRVARGLRA
ncbi:hypothetical protein, partial [Nonomuraea lactucae]|uniref:hypothetical protein n=1 Tax=Nonomuraea lactucae TaxID=2249762 RepID=UPI0013B44990